jgi:cell division protein FtsZ
MGLVKTLSGQFAKIKVIGVGGGGNNAINSMIAEGNIQGVDFVAVNTDSQALLQSQAEIKIQIGDKLTRGLGAGGKPQMGQKAAEESKDRIKELLSGTDMVFIAGGMGGGTCTGAAPIIAQIAKKELGILTIAVVTKPFFFEGTHRMTNAEEGILNLKQYVDALIVIPNQKVMDILATDQDMPITQAFKLADSVLTKGTKAIADIITLPGHINLDFADIRSIMSDAGTALMGVGEAEGEDRAQKAIDDAIHSPLVEVDIAGARGVLINIAGGSDLGMREVALASEIVRQQASADANIIFGTTLDESLKGKIKITIIATGFDESRLRKQAPKVVSQAQLGENNNPFNHNYNLQNLPEGLEIESEFDIPSFLKRQQ